MERNNTEISDILIYYDWFDKYVSNYLSKAKSDEVYNNLKIKIVHSKNVANNAKDIAKSLNLTNADILLSEICGLFHDIGRFKQYITYNTFKDSDNLYHGDIGVKELSKQDIIKELSKNNQTVLLSAIYDHGLKSIPKERKGKELMFSEITRDADKLDIFALLSKYYKTEGPRNISLEYGLSDISEISKNVFNSLIARTPVDKKDLKTLNDFKIMQLAWIFDVHYNYTLTKIYSESHLNIIIESLKTDYSVKQEIYKILNIKKC